MMGEHAPYHGGYPQEETETMTDSRNLVVMIIVFQSIPESLVIYRLCTDDVDVLDSLRKCQGQYVGSADCPADVEKTLSMIEEFEGIEKIYDDTDAEKAQERVILDRNQYEVIVTGMTM